jgi:hypothetical protein
MKLEAPTPEFPQVTPFSSIKRLKSRFHWQYLRFGFRASKSPMDQFPQSDSCQNCHGRVVGCPSCPQFALPQPAEAPGGEFTLDTHYPGSLVDQPIHMETSGLTWHPFIDHRDTVSDLYPNELLSFSFDARFCNPPRTTTYNHLVLIITPTSKE